MKAEAEAVFEAQPVLDLSHADFSLRWTVSWGAPGLFPMRTGKFDAAPSWLCVVLTFGRLIYSVKETVLTMSTSGYQPHVGTSQHWAQMRSHWQVSLCEVQVDFQKHLPRPKSDSLISEWAFLRLCMDIWEGWLPARCCQPSFTSFIKNVFWIFFSGN